MPDQEGASAGEAETRISPWWLLVGAIALGAALTAIADVIPGSPKLSAVEWLGTTVGVAALVIAVGIYRLQERSGNEAHAELMDQLEAQNELLNEFAKRAAEKGEEERGEPVSLSDEQRAAIEDRFGKDSIEVAIDPGRGRGGRRPGARLVRLHDGRLVSVYTSGRGNRTYVREIGEGAPRRERMRPGRGPGQ